MSSDRTALALVLLTSAAVLGGALLFQHVGGLAPCEMCWWQRYAHVAVLTVGVAALAARGATGRALTGVAAVTLVAAGLFGAFHAGVELGWWNGPTACSAAIDFRQSSGALLGAMLNTPVVRCDVVAWSLLGLSMAGWNAVISVGIGLAASWLRRRA